MNKAVLLLLLFGSLAKCEDYLSNLDVDLSQLTYDQILYKAQHPNEDFITRWKRQVKEPESFRQLSLPQIEIPFRDMASIVSEAEAAIINRFEVCMTYLMQWSFS